MKKSYVLPIISLVITFAVVLTSNAFAQEPIPQSPQSESTPTPQPTDDSLEIQIVGGQPAGPGEYPWQVAIVDAATSNPLFGQFCGGSLIAPEWVLTAAHCVVDQDSGLVTEPADINVVLGINNLSDGPPNGAQGQRLNVAEVIPFSGYNRVTLDNDIALLRLATPATLGATVDLIDVVGPDDGALFEPGDTAIITGWGDTSEGGSSSNALLEVSVPIISNSICNTPSSYNGEITENMLCAGQAAGGQDACQGDSGGPLVVSNGTGVWLQAGVVSWGEGCARPNFYGVYTRVSQFESWINFQINGPSNMVYLPMVIRALASSPVACIPSPPGESDNVFDALTICSGQTVTGEVNDNDRDDVYAIFALNGQTLTISMNGTGVGGPGDADLYLYPPDTIDIDFDPFVIRSNNSGNSEFIRYRVPETGFWYIDVYDYDDGDGSGTNYSLIATLSGAGSTEIETFDTAGIKPSHQPALGKSQK